jgi:hypothetical protein
MRLKEPLLILALILVLSVISCTAPVEQLPTPSLPALPLEEPPPDSTPQPALLEHRYLQLEWPQRIRENDSDLIVLSIKMDDQGNLTPVVEASGLSTQGTPVDIPNIYDTHNIVAVARLDMAGLQAYRDEVREPLRPGREVAFRWSIRAEEAGLYRGVVWLHLELVPLAGGPTERLLLMARTIDIETVTVFGMPGDIARILGFAGVLLSTTLGFPFIQRQLENWMKRWRRQPPAPPSTPESQSETTQNKEGNLPE